MKTKRMRLLALVAAGLMAGGALAASSVVKDVTIRQVKPWQGMVQG